MKHLFWIVFLFACQPRVFQGDKKSEAGNPSGAQTPLTADGKPDPNTKNDPGTGGSATPVATTNVPVKDAGTPTATPTTAVATACELGNTKKASTNGSRQVCPEGSVVYAADDADETSLACCNAPVPALLGTERSSAGAGNTCAADSVAVGVESAGSTHILCQRINTDLYALGSLETACYFGSGATGKNGAKKCKIPKNFVNALKNAAGFGTDGCLAGTHSLIVGRSGKNCGDIKMRQLIRKSDNTPIETLERIP